MTGPTILAIAKVEAKVPVHIALLCNGIMVVRITKPPAKMPEAPSPAIARPTINAFDDGARAHTRLPISNIASEDR